MKRNFLIAISLFLLISSSCRKNNNGGTPVVPIQAGMLSSFGYMPGSYWIYKDSATGVIDSAYVTTSVLDTTYIGCVLRSGTPKYQGMGISLNISDGNVADTERWNFYMMDSTCNMTAFNNQDSIESVINVRLFTYPFALGNMIVSSCILNFDSGYVADILPQITVNSQNYTNTARSAHASSSEFTRYIYNDYFYVNENAGLVKLVFNHPQKSVYRVLELVRYHLVK